MKCLVVSEYYLPTMGGHTVWLHEICKRFEDARVITRLLEGTARRETIEGVDVERIKLGRIWYCRPESLPMYANLLWTTARIARRNRSVPILAARVLPEGLVANASARIAGSASVIFAHGEEVKRWGGMDSYNDRRRCTAALKRITLWRVYRGASMVIANTAFTKDLLTGGGVDRSRICVIHPGTDPRRFRPMRRDGELVARFGLAEARTILTIGRLVCRKGQDMVIRAMPHVLKRVPDAVYVIGGEGAYGTVLRDLARKAGVESHVRFIGKVDEEVLPSIYNLADVFVMPNRVPPDSGDVEGFGIVFLEANACGVPVIGGNTGGVPEAIVQEKTGLLVDGTSVQSIADNIVRILTNPALARRLGQDGRKRVCEELTWDHSAAKVKELLEETDRSRHSGRRERESVLAKRERV